MIALFLAQCCFCITDLPSHHVQYRGLQKYDCQNWLAKKTAEGSCQYSEKIFVSDSFDGLFDERSSQLQCQKVNIYTNFHGSADLSSVPFEISNQASAKLGASEVNYDGATCFVFDNVDEALKSANQLSADSPKVKYTISGNQNVGVVTSSKNIFMRIFKRKSTTEQPGTESRVTFKLDSGKVGVKYGACSEPGSRCMWDHEENIWIGSNNDPNSKACWSGKSLVQQSCCSKRSTAKGVGNGTWSPPGLGCQ